MTKKSILYIITKSVWGGAAKYVYDLATHLSNELEVAVLAGGQEKFAQKIEQANLPYYQIKNFQRTINPLKDFFAFFEILSLTIDLKPNIIHVNSPKAGGIVGVAGRIYKIFSPHSLRLIYTPHGWAFSEDRPQWQIWLIKLFSRITCLFYDKIICVSQDDLNLALKNKIAPVNKLVVIHNGIDIDSLSFLPRQPARKKLLGRISPPAGGLVVGTIAEWTKNKGIFYLLEAVKQIKEPLDLVLIGSGENPDKEKVYNFIEKHRLKNVHLIEWIEQAAIYLKAFDIFVLPSIKEGLPYTILEAMAAQLPIIASRIGGVPEMVEGVGLLIPPKNSRELAAKIIYLINNSQAGQKMAGKARQKVTREFSLEKMIQKTKKAYF